MITEKDAENKGFLASAADGLKNAITPVHLTYVASWNKRGKEVASNMSNPIISRISGKLGWDKNNHRFQFAAFSIERDGNVLHGNYLPHGLPLPSDNIPPITDAAMLINIRELWTAAGIVLWQLLSSVAGKKLPTVAIETADVQECRNLFALLGCRDDAISRYGWPALSDCKAALYGDLANRIYIGDALDSWAGATNNLTRVRLPRLPAMEDAKQRTAFASIIPSYLSYLCKSDDVHKLRFDSFDKCHKHLMSWAKTTGRTSLLRTRKTPAVSADSYAAVIQTIYHLWQQYPRSVLSDDRKEPGIVWFDGEKIQAQLASRSLPVTPLGRMLTAFEKWPGYVGQTPLHPGLECGIYIDSWLQSDLEAAQTKTESRVSNRKETR